MKETEKVLTEIDIVLMNFNNLEAFERSGQTLVVFDTNFNSMVYDLSGSHDRYKMLADLKPYDKSDPYLKLKSLLEKFS